MTDDPAGARLQFLVGLVATVLLAVGAYVILAPFLVSIAWAAILATATWPVFRRVRAVLGGHDLWAALVMTLFVVLAVAGPVTLLSFAVADDVAAVLRTVRAWADEPPVLPAWVSDLPVVGSYLVGWYDWLRNNPEGIQRLVLERGAWLTQTVLGVAGSLGRNLVQVLLTLLTVFFLYRHGDVLLVQTHRVIDRLAGSPVQHRLAIVGATIRAVCYGVLLTALIQGSLLGVALWAAGVPQPALLGALTAGVALTPVGPPLIWLPAGLWVLTTQSTWKGVALLLWGALVVSSVDNVLRPYFIGGPTQIPFLLLLFGVLGGLAAFGLLGLFIGPTVLAVGLVLWREWSAAPRTADAAT